MQRWNFMPFNEFKINVVDNPIVSSLYNNNKSETIQPAPPTSDYRITNALEKRITNVTSDGRITNE